MGTQRIKHALWCQLRSLGHYKVIGGVLENKAISLKSVLLKIKVAYIDQLFYMHSNLTIL